MNYKYNQAFCEAFGRRVRELRENAGLSMRDFATKADMEYSQLSKIERGVINTTISTVYSLAEALEIQVEDLFKFNIRGKLPK